MTAYALELAWRARRAESTQTPRRFLDFIVEGDSLYERHGLDLISPLGWCADDEDERAARALLRQEPPDVDGRVALYVCPEDGDLYCGAVTAVIDRQGDEVVWRDIGHSTFDFLANRWDHAPLPTWDDLRFAGAEYWRAIPQRPRGRG